MKNIYLLSIVMLLLSGCYYDSQCGNFRAILEVVLPYCPNFGEDFPPYAYYQKPNQIGHTDSEQRWRDLVACGAARWDKGLFQSIKSPDEEYFRNGPGWVDPKMAAFEQCMRNKGYIKLPWDACGDQLPRNNTGKCNL